MPKREMVDRQTTIHMSAFGQTFNLPLKPNTNLLSPYAKVVDTYTDPATGKIVALKFYGKNCCKFCSMMMLLCCCAHPHENIGLKYQIFTTSI